MLNDRGHGETQRDSGRRPKRFGPEAGVYNSTFLFDPDTNLSWRRRSELCRLPTSSFCRILFMLPTTTSPLRRPLQLPPVLRKSQTRDLLQRSSELGRPGLPVWLTSKAADAYLLSEIPEIGIYLREERGSTSAI